MMTPAERDARVERDRAEKREREQAERDRIADMERQARARQRANAVEAQRLLDGLGAKLAPIVGDLARLDGLVGHVALVDAIRDSMRDAGVSPYDWHVLGVLGDVGRPQPAQPWPQYRQLFPMQIG